MKQKHLTFLFVLILVLILVSGTLVSQVTYSGGSKFMGSIGNPVMAPDGESFYARISVFDPAAMIKVK